MYVLPLIVFFLIALAIFFSPLLAVVLLVLVMLGFGGVKYLGGSSVVDAENAPSGGAGAAAQADVGTPSQASSQEQEGGIWGETWPEEREERSSS